MKRYLKKAYYAIVPWRNVSKKIFDLYRKMNKAHKKGNSFLAGFYCHKIEKKYERKQVAFCVKNWQYL